MRHHNAQKMLLLAHDPEAYRRLGRRVAAAGSPETDFSALLDEYERLAMAALRKVAAPSGT